MSDTKLTITVGIPTCYGGGSLLATAKSIYASVGVHPDAFIICADRTPLAPEIKRELEEMGVQLIWNSVAGSQFKKLQQIIAKTTTDLLVFTQDDIMFDTNALRNLVNAFEHDEQLTMASVRVLPLPPVTLFERGMASTLRIHGFISRYWKSGDNYLAASGRCLVFRTRILRDARIPENMVNGDTFLYFENKRLGGTFEYVHSAIVSIRCPQQMREQFGPSGRYQYSKNELLGYFEHDLSREYRIPIGMFMVSVGVEMLVHPIATSIAIYSFFYTRLKKQPRKNASNTIWDVEGSTKITHS